MEHILVCHELFCVYLISLWDLLSESSQIILAVFQLFFVCVWATLNGNSRANPNQKCVGKNTRITRKTLKVKQSIMGILDSPRVKGIVR